MSKAAKLTMIIAGIAVALVLAALIVFAATFDINDYKDRIASAVKRSTGRTLTFQDDIGLSFLPPAVKMGGVTLSNAAGFDPRSMVGIRSAEVSVRFLPLLKGEVRFGHLMLDGLTLNLSRKADGSANWDDLSDQESGAQEPASGSGSFPLQVEEISVTNAHLEWDDRAEGTRVAVRDLNLTTGTITPGAPFPFELRLRYESATPAVRGRVELTGQAALDHARRVYGPVGLDGTVTAQGDDVPGGEADASLSVTKATLDLGRDRAEVAGLTLNGYGLTAHVDGNVNGMADGLRKLTATVRLEQADLREVLQGLGVTPPETADPEALSRVGGRAEMVYQPGNLRLRGLDAELDGTTVTGQARVQRVDGLREYFARLDVGELDLDRYLPPGQPGGEDAAQESGDGPLFEMDAVRRLLLDVEARCEKLRVKGVWLSKVTAKAKARHGMVRLSPVSADLYGGTLSAGVTLNATSEHAMTDVIAGLDSVDVGALSRDALGDESYGGVLDFKSTLSCRGERIEAMLRSMNGKVSFNLADGIFPGVNLKKMARETHADEDRKGKVVADKTDATRFGSITGTGSITGGVLRNRDLEVKAPGVRADGQGAIALPTGRVDYLLKVKLVPTSEGQGGKSSGEMFGVMVPIRVGGTVQNPHYWVSLTEYVKALGGAVLDTAGAVIGGVTGAITGVGKALTGGDAASDTKTEPKKKGGLLDLF